MKEVTLVALAAARAGAREGIAGGGDLGLGSTTGPLPGERLVDPDRSNTYLCLAFRQLDLGYAQTGQLDIHLVVKFFPYNWDGIGKNGGDLNRILTNGLGILLLPLAPFVHVFVPLGSSHALVGGGATYYLQPEARACTSKSRSARPRTQPVQSRFCTPVSAMSSGPTSPGS